MSEQTIDQSGPPNQFGLTVPGWWPRVEPVFDIGDRVAEELEPDQAEALREMFSSVNAMDGTRLISVMMSAEDEPRPMGIMYVNHSENAGRVMSGMLGIEATPAEVPDLRAVGKLKDTEVSVVHFDGVGSVSCVTSRRESAAPEGRGSLIRAYIIPQPQSLQAVLILYMTAYHDVVLEPFAELCDDVTSSFNWRWGEARIRP